MTVTAAQMVSDIKDAISARLGKAQSISTGGASLSHHSLESLESLLTKWEARAAREANPTSGGMSFGTFTPVRS